MFNAERVKSWIPKKLMVNIEEIDEDTEVVEVILKEGFMHSSYEETVWVFGKHRYTCKEYTLAQIKEDLRGWLEKVVAIPA